LAQDSRGRLIGGGGAGWFVSRYLGNGQLDLGFGVRGGRAKIASSTSEVNAVAVQPDRKILAAGSTELGNFVMDRYDADGTRLDPGFGGKLRDAGKQPGQVVTRAGYYGGGVQDIEVEPNGRILAAGYGVDIRHRWRAMLVAYRPSGALERRFGDEGIVTLRPTVKGEVPIELVSVKALPDGKIRAAGYVDGRTMLIGLRPNGTADNRFGGGDGVVLTEPDRVERCACSYVTDMEIDRRGRIVLTANVTAPRGRQPAALIRYRSDGRLDRSFGKRGIARVVLGSRFAGKDLAIQHDGKLVLAGDYNVPATGEARVAVARLRRDGGIDRSFARRGFFVRDFGYEGVAYSALTQRDGRVVVAGRANATEPVPEFEFPASVYDNAEVFLIRFLPR